MLLTYLVFRAPIQYLQHFTRVRTFHTEVTQPHPLNHFAQGLKVKNVRNEGY